MPWIQKCGSCDAHLLTLILIYNHGWMLETMVAGSPAGACHFLCLCLFMRGTFLLISNPKIFLFLKKANKPSTFRSLAMMAIKQEACYKCPLPPFTTLNALLD